MVNTVVSSKVPRIQALARASAIIDVIAVGGVRGVSLGEISKVTDLNKTTAFNLLSSLITLRFLEQDKETKRYRLGMRNIELGRIAQRRLRIPDLARPVLVDLCHTTNETVSLALSDQLDVLVVDSFEGSQFLHATAYMGSRSEYHCTALGKAVLAQYDESMRQTIYRLRGLPQRTLHTITDIDILEAQLLQIKAQGYALDLEENEVGANCIGTSIFNGFGEAVAAISVTGPSTRMTPDVLEKFSSDLMTAAKLITAAIESGKQSDNHGSRRFK